MTPLMFKDAFWGTEFTCHAGYEAIIERLHDGRKMCKDVEELLKMRSLAEEKYGKELVTIARKAGGHTEIRTMRASFDQLKEQIENTGNFHIHLSEKLKEEVKKIEAFRERQKEQRKKFESIMEKVQKKKVSLYKKTMESKRNYKLRSKEAVEAEQGAEKTCLTSKNPEKVWQRAKQCRQTAKEAEILHFNNTTELQNVHRDWEETHRSTCEVFQQLEGDRISMLRGALWDHCNHLSMQCVKDDECYEEVRKHLEQCDVITDNNYFIKTKGTGTRPPETILFETSYHEDTARDGNDLSHYAEVEEDMISRSASLSMDSLPISQPALTSIDESQSSDGRYISTQYAKPVAAASADEDKYVAHYDYTARDLDEMSVSRGDVVQVVERGEDGWWTVSRNGQTGLVPGNFLGKIRTQ